MTFPDGKNPPKAVVNEWLALVRSFWKQTRKDKDFSSIFQKDSPLAHSHNSETLTADHTPVNMTVNNKNSPKHNED